jgi:hypothetical protein
MESKCEIASLVGDTLVIVLNGANRHELESLVQGKDYRIKLSKWTEKRSLTANSYAWLLCTKLAQAVDSSKDEIYEQMLQAYGTVDEDFPPITVIAGADMSITKEHWLWIDKRKVGDKDFDCYLRIKGSSEMDTREMAHFIDGIVFECKQYGIETMNPDELQALKEQWGIEINTSN